MEKAIIAMDWRDFVVVSDVNFHTNEVFKEINYRSLSMNMSGLTIVYQIRRE